MIMAPIGSAPTFPGGCSASAQAVWSPREDRTDASAPSRVVNPSRALSRLKQDRRSELLVPTVPDDDEPLPRCLATDDHFALVLELSPAHWPERSVGPCNSTLASIPASRSAAGRHAPRLPGRTQRQPPSPRPLPAPICLRESPCGRPAADGAGRKRGGTSSHQSASRWYRCSWFPHLLKRRRPPKRRSGAWSIRLSSMARRRPSLRL